MSLRILESQWTPFAERLCTRSDVETAGIILAERLRGGALLARHLLDVPEDGYLVRRADHIRIDPVVINRLVRRARNEQLSVITAHTHPHSTRPWFSEADDIGDSRLMPSLFAQMPGPHGSLVVAGDTRLPTARVWTQPDEMIGIDVRTVGTMLTTARPPSRIGDMPTQEWFDRQRLALGEYGQAALRRLHVGVVGLGGTGSVVFAQLVHLGVGRVTVIDRDLVEQSNVSRVLGATVADAGKTWKVEVAARYAQQLGLGTQVDICRGHLGADVATEVLESCDVVMSCVDRHLPRALLNRLAYEKAIPTIDMGSAFRVDTAGKLVACAGRVVVVGPRRPCLACWGHLEANRIRIESLSPADRAREIADGYIDGTNVPQPSVIAFNTAVAGAAMIELLRLVTGFAGTEESPMRLSFDFEKGTVRRNRLANSALCRICRP